MNMSGGFPFFRSFIFLKALRYSNATVTLIARLLTQRCSLSCQLQGLKVVTSRPASGECAPMSSPSLPSARCPKICVHSLVSSLKRPIALTQSIVTLGRFVFISKLTLPNFTAETIGNSIFIGTLS